MYYLYINDEIYNFQSDPIEFGVSTNPNGSTFIMDTTNKVVPEILDIVKIVDDSNNIIYTGYIQTITATVEPNPDYNYIYEINTLSLLNLLSMTYPYIYYPNDRVQVCSVENIINDLCNIYSSKLNFTLSIQGTVKDYTFEAYNTGNLSLYAIFQELANYADMVMYITQDNILTYKKKDEPCGIVLSRNIYDVSINNENQIYTNIIIDKIPVPITLTYDYSMKKVIVADETSTDPSATKQVVEFTKDINIDIGYKLLSGELEIYDKSGTLVQTFSVPIKSQKIEIDIGGSSATTHSRQQQYPFLLSGKSIVGNDDYTGSFTFYVGYVCHFTVVVERNIKLNQTNITLKDQLKNRTNMDYELALNKSVSPSSLSEALKYIEQLSTAHEKGDIHLTFKTRQPIGFSLLSPVMVDLPERNIVQEIYYIQEINFNIFSAYGNIEFEYTYTLTNKKSIILGEDLFTPLEKVRDEEQIQKSYIYNDLQYYTEEYTYSTPYYNYVVDPNNNPLGNLNDGIINYLS